MGCNGLDNSVDHKSLGYLLDDNQYIFISNYGISHGVHDLPRHSNIIKKLKLVNEAQALILANPVLLAIRHLH